MPEVVHVTSCSSFTAQLEALVGAPNAKPALIVNVEADSLLEAGWPASASETRTLADEVIASGTVHENVPSLETMPSLDVPSLSVKFTQLEPL